MQIKTKLPINVKMEHLHLFNGKQYYSLRPLKMREIKNVFITHWGLLLKNFFLPRRSAENLLGNYDQTFYVKHWRIALEQFFVSKFGKSLPSVKLNDEKLYFSIHTPWFGYFSWLTTYLPRLISVSEKYPNAVLLVPEEWRDLPFVDASLQLFDNVEKKVIEHDHHIFVKNYIFCETRPWTSMFYPEHIEQVRQLFFSAVENKENNLEPIKRIYISRKKTNRRKVLNEEVIEKYLFDNDFQSICFEDYSIFDQVFLMKNAEIVVSMHGAGMTNGMFMKPNSILFELSPEINDHKLFRFPFWRIASIVDVKYYIQFCESVNGGEDDYYSRNIIVDFQEFKENMDLVIQQ